MAANRFELLATWYLRFNGYFIAPDFTIHPDSKKLGGGTDADVLAVRFRHSVESQARYNVDRDPILPREVDVEFLICEVKKGMCDINPNTWRRSDRGNVEYAIRWMGFEWDGEKIAAISKELYDRGAWKSLDGKVAVRFLSFGGRENEDLRKALPDVQCVLHPQVITFLRTRFNTGCVQIARDNWDPAIIDFASKCNSHATDTELLAWAQEP